MVQEAQALSAMEVLSHFCCSLVIGSEDGGRKFSQAVQAIFSGKPFSNRLSLGKQGARQLSMGNQHSLQLCPRVHKSWLMKMTRFGEAGTCIIHVDAVCQERHETMVCLCLVVILALGYVPR